MWEWFSWDVDSDNLHVVFRWVTGLGLIILCLFRIQCKCWSNRDPILENSKNSVRKCFNQICFSPPSNELQVCYGTSVTIKSQNWQSLFIQRILVHCCSTTFGSISGTQVLLILDILHSLDSLWSVYISTRLTLNYGTVSFAKVNLFV